MIGQAKLLKELTGLASEQNEAALGNPLPCERPALSGRQVTQAAELASSLQAPYPKADAACLAGDRRLASEIYLRQLVSGDTAAVMPAYAGLARNGMAGSFQSILSSIPLNTAEIVQFVYWVDRDDLPIDTRPLVQALASQDPSNPETWRAWLSTGEPLRRDQEYAAALAWYRLALDNQQRLGVNDFQSSFYYRMALVDRAAAGAENAENARKALETALSIDNFSHPDDKVGAYSNLGDVYLSLPGYGPDRALEQYKLALQIYPDDIWLMLSMGSVYQRQKDDPVRALEWYQRVVDSNPGSPYGYYSRGDVYQQMGNLAAAGSDYQRALQMKPDWEAPRQRLGELQAGE